MPRRYLLLLIVAISFAAGPARGADWPAAAHDPGRTGVTAETLALPLAPAWIYRPAQPPRPAWPRPIRELNRMDFDYAPIPVVAGGMVYFGSSADDTVRALGAATGRMKWRFTTGGPVRFAPTVAAGRCYVGSDDGCVYCLDAADGKLVWEFCAAPAGDLLLGNGRMISRWPIRTGVLVDAGVAYFAAGMWPSQGIHLYALEAAGGRPMWRNDTSGSMYIELPHHGASAFTGVAPQGYLLASDGVLLVPTGRSVPAAFDRKTGRLIHYAPGSSKHDGGCWATLMGEVYFNGSHRRQLDDEAHVGEAQPREGDGMAAFHVGSGVQRPDLSLPDRYLVLAHDRTIYAADSNAVEAIDLADHSRSDRLTEEPKWRSPHGRTYSFALAGGTLLAGGADVVTAFDAESGKQTWAGEVTGQVRGLAVADGRLLVATDAGRIVCYGRPAVPAPPRQVIEKLSWQAAGPGAHRQLAARAARVAGVSKGYALVLGPDDAKLAVSLAMQTDLHVLATVDDASAAAAARERILTTDLYGSRVAVTTVAELPRLPYAPYFADLVLVAAGEAVKRLRGDQLLRVLRPCGGVICLADTGDGEADRLIREAKLPASAVRTVGRIKLFTRGPLEGAGQWRSQWANPAQTGSSTERRLRLPLDVLWFGGPGPDRMMDRHWGAATPVCAGGRVFVTGQHHLIAFDAYNGRELWSRPLRHVGRTGSVWRAGNLLADGPSLYVQHEAVCHRLDQATGRLLAVYQMPAELADRADARPAGEPVDVAWPAKWQVFGPVPSSVKLLSGEKLDRVPKALAAGGKTYRPRALDAVGGVLDFTCLYGGFGFPPLPAGRKPAAFPRGKAKRDRKMHRTTAYAFAEIDCPTAGRLAIGAAGDWYMAWFLDGKAIYDTLKGGNRSSELAVTDHVFQTKVAAGRHVLAVAVQAGTMGWSLTAAGGAKYEGQLADKLAGPPPHWGYAAAVDGLLLGTRVDPNDGSGGGRALFALDADSGRTRWLWRPGGLIPNTGVAVADGRVFALLSRSPEEFARAARRGEKIDMSQTLVALDLAGGKEIWRRRGVAYADGRLLQVARGVVVVGAAAAYDAETGRRLWAVDARQKGRLVGRQPVICGEWVYTHPGATHLKTGRQRMTTDLLTGRRRPWGYVRAYGCGHVGGAEDLLFFRSGAAGLFDVSADGTANFGGVRPGCSVTMVAAAGLMILPESSSGCTCSYNFQTSLALVPSARRRVEPWYVFYGEPPDRPVKRLRVNFGAPGDRRDGEAAWLAFPRPGAPGSCPVPLTIDFQTARWPRRTDRSRAIRAGGRGWIYDAALAGAGRLTATLRPDPPAEAPESPAPLPAPAERAYTVRLHFLEPPGGAPGKRVFDVAIQGRIALEDFDIARAAGGPGRAVVREFRAVRAAGKLTVTLTAKKGEPQLCGLEIVEE